MNWLNIHTDDLRSDAFIGADPVERGTWLCILAWCITQENGGRIIGAKSWKDRKWQQLCGVTLQEVSLESELYVFEGDDLIIPLYPAAKEKEVARKRETARANGRLGGRPKKETLIPQEKEPTSVSEKTNVAPYVEKRKGKSKGNEKDKGNEIEEEDNLEDPAPKKKEWKADEYQLRFNALFNRRPTTRWNDKELKAYKAIDVHEDDLSLIEKFHAADTFHRTALLTLLNNWNTEIDRANAWISKPQQPQSQQMSFGQQEEARRREEYDRNMRGLC